MYVYAAVLCETISTRNRQTHGTGDKIRATAVSHPSRSRDSIKTEEDCISGEGNALFLGADCCCCCMFVLLLLLLLSV